MRTNYLHFAWKAVIAFVFKSTYKVVNLNCKLLSYYKVTILWSFILFVTVCVNMFFGYLILSSSHFWTCMLAYRRIVTTQVELCYENFIIFCFRDSYSTYYDIMDENCGFGPFFSNFWSQNLCLSTFNIVSRCIDYRPAWACFEAGVIIHQDTFQCFWTKYTKY